MASKENLFRATLKYTPKQLEFGTSGLRGLVTDMTDLECYINAAGFIKFLAEHDGLQDGAEVYLAGDLRGSTPRIMAAVAAAIQDASYRVINCGLIPTPALALWGMQHDSPSIIVTGSHIPADRNGIKFYKRSGEVLKDDEGPINVAVSEARTLLYEQPADVSAFDADGNLQQRFTLPPAISEAKESFCRRYTDIFKDKPLSGKHIIVYQHSAVGRDMLVQVLESLGATVSPVRRSDAFVPIDTENVTPADKEVFRQIATEFPDNFATVSTDGDSDRPFLIDETGSFHHGDIVGCLVAEYLDADFAATPISSNDVMDSYCRDKGMKLIHTKIGSPYVIKAMQGATSSSAKVVGWEVNGGFLLGSDVEVGDGVLRALPTRDAFLPLITVLLMAAEKGTKVSNLFKELSSRCASAGLIDLDNVETARQVVRLINDDPKQVEQFFTAELAPLKIVSSDATDGLRMRISNGEIVHIRPSNNAPQLRIYTNADSQQRAEELVVQAVAQNGLLQKFLETVGRD